MRVTPEKPDFDNGGVSTSASAAETICSEMATGISGAAIGEEVKTGISALLFLYNCLACFNFQLENDL